MGTTPAASGDQSFHTHVARIPFDPSLIEKIQTMGKQDPSQYVIFDDDAQACRIVEQAELFGAYVDGHIATFQLDGIETWPQIPNPDLHNVTITYQNGNKATLSVGSISLDSGPGPDHYLQSQGVIYPIDSSGALLLDATNTPNLTLVRKRYWDMAREKVETDLFFAELVATFASDVSGLGQAADAANFVGGGGISAPEFNGVMPTPPSVPENYVDTPAPDQGSGAGSGSSSDGN